MDLLLILTYSAVCIVIFKAFKIPLTKWTVPTAVLGGIVIIGTLIVAMNYNHPFSERSREYFITTPIVPTVSGTVIEKTAKPNTFLSKGDVLFKLDPEPFQYAVASLKAKLTSAEEDMERAKSLLKRNAGSQRNVDITVAAYEDLRAQLHDANYDLENTIVRAPTDGYVTQDFLRPGMQAVSMPLRPVMVFVHKDEVNYIGWFRQNSLLRLKPGYAAEISFDALPGKVFSAEVVAVLPAMSEGQLQASGDLMSLGPIVKPGRVAVTMKIIDPDFEPYRKQLPGGAFAQSAIYSDHAEHLAIMRKVLLRMASWMNYLFPFH